MISNPASEIVITPGDPEGVGPEVTAKALRALRATLGQRSIKIFGSQTPFKKISLPRLKIEFIEPPSIELNKIKSTLRKSGFSLPGFQSGWSIQAATEYLLQSPQGRTPLITGPISKERIQAGGFKYRGHTDMLAELTRTPQVTMMLANNHFRVALLTDHCPLHAVSSRLTPALLDKTFHNLYRFTTQQLGIDRPKIAVLGLNPHAGEGGLLGQEEKKILSPAMKRARKRWPSLQIEGPISADSYFGVIMNQKKSIRPDIILACYHDQGLIPVKLSGFGSSVNITIGLPFIRTSVDHGTAFSIAGKNQADPGSMICAIQSALELSSIQRRNNKE